MAEATDTKFHATSGVNFSSATYSTVTPHCVYPKRHWMMMEVSVGMSVVLGWDTMNMN